MLAMHRPLQEEVLQQRQTLFVCQTELTQASNPRELQ